MIESKSISWQLLRGNKYNRCLHPAMLTEKGCTKQMSTSPVGYNERQYFDVHYDREYVVNWLATKVIKPLENVGVRELVELLIAAWLKRHPDETKTSYEEFEVANEQ